METIITVSKLGKAYRIGSAERDGTLAEVAWRTLTAPVRNLRRLRQLRNVAADATTVHHALSDVSFSVRRGEVLGIIGHNGAGKSTLLKVLSRITNPTSGAAELRGRVASLLEVGTGFHAELTGRENVMMNGILLGMSRGEVTQKFDEIVAFSGVAKHIDTPLKFYSSGMKVRLAFAVAAHLDPEILIIDEVLAVGDLAFQEKCLSKMDDVSASGRTILFVSHNMAAVEGLCDRCLLLEGGRVVFDGDVPTAVARYRASVARRSGETPLGERTDRYGTGEFRFTELAFNGGEAVYAGAPLSVAVAGVATTALVDLQLTVRLCRTFKDRVLMLDSKQEGARLTAMVGPNHYRIELPRLPVVPGTYLVELWANGADATLDGMFDAASLTVLPPAAGGYATREYDARNGPVLPPPARWSEG